MACVAGVRRGKGDSGEVTSALSRNGYAYFPASLAPEFPPPLSFSNACHTGYVLGYLLCRITEVSIRMNHRMLAYIE